jgi:hypothetical protein
MANQGSSGIGPPPASTGEVRANNVVPFRSEDGPRPGMPLAPGGSGPHDPDMEARVAKLESDVEHIKNDISEIKGILARLAPIIDRIDGFLQATLPGLATKLELADLRAEIQKRPTHRQIIFDLFALAGFVGVILAIATRSAH